MEESALRLSQRPGFCVWFTGLPASGKSTTASAVARLLKKGGCRVDLLDGDSLRRTVSKGIGFSRQDRDDHIRRVGSLAAESVAGGRAAVCAVISPYRAARAECRTLVGSGRFIEVFMDTPLEICQARDPKGLYAKARRGEIPNFTGVSDPYEPPQNPELSLETVRRGVEENAREVIGLLLEKGFLPWR